MKKLFLKPPKVLVIALPLATEFIFAPYIQSALIFSIMIWSAVHFFLIMRVVIPQMGNEMAYGLFDKNVHKDFDYWAFGKGIEMCVWGFILMVLTWIFQ